MHRAKPSPTSLSNQKARFRTEFGSALSIQLAKQKTTAASLAEKLGITASYATQTMTGHTRASPRWVDLVSDALNLCDTDRGELHIAAARDYGYKIDLTPKK
jgi:hypothetical protein